MPILAVAALLVMLLEAAPGGVVVLPGVVGALFVTWSVVGYRWVLGRGRLAAVGYLVIALALGFVVFDLAGAGVGSTLLLVVVVVQAVVLLPLGWAVVVAVLVPFVHVGMPMADAVRQVVSTGLACAFAFVLAALLGARTGRITGAARTFVVLNWAAVAGLWRWVRGAQRITW